MALAPTTIPISGTYTCLNPSNPAAAEFSAFLSARGGSGMLIKVSASTTPTNDDAGAIFIPASGEGGGIINQTIAQLFPGSASQYVHARMERQGMSGNVVIACA